MIVHIQVNARTMRSEVHRASVNVVANLQCQTVLSSGVDHIPLTEHDKSDSIAIKAAPPAIEAP